MKGGGSEIPLVYARGQDFRSSPRAPIGARHLESFAYLQVGTLVRLAETVSPDLHGRAPYGATLQAGCPGNRLSKKLPTTTNRKP